MDEGQRNKYADFASKMYHADAITGKFLWELHTSRDIGIKMRQNSQELDFIVLDREIGLKGQDLHLYNPRRPFHNGYQTMLTQLMNHGSDTPATYSRSFTTSRR